MNFYVLGRKNSIKMNLKVALGKNNIEKVKY